MELIALQPGFLRLCFSFAYEDEGLLALNKPFDTRMDVPKGEDRKWPHELTCADWIASARPGLDKMRFAHNLDSAVRTTTTTTMRRQLAMTVNG